MLTARGRLETRSEVEANRAEARAERRLAQAERASSLEFGLPDAEIAEIAADVANGTPEQQERFRGVLEQEAMFRAFRFAPPDAARAGIAEIEAKYAANGASIIQQQGLVRMRAAVESNAKLLHDAPLEHMRLATGQEIPPLDFNSVQSDGGVALANQINERGVLRSAYAQKMGIATGRGLLLPREASLLAQVFSTSTPTQQAQTLGMFNNAIDNREDYLALMSQIAPSSPVVAAAGALMPGPDAKDNAETQQQVRFVETMLKGERALSPTDGNAKLKMPPAADIAAGLQEVAPAYAGRNEAFQLTRRAIEAAYAGMSDEIGDYSGEINPQRLREAVRKVAGVPVIVGGAPLLKPNGMDEGDFIDAIDYAWNNAATRLQRNASTELDDYRLRHEGATTFSLIDKEGRYLQDADGKPLWLRIDPAFKAAPPAPLSSSGTADPFGMRRVIEGEQ